MKYKKKDQLFEYLIYGNEENVLRFIKSKNIFIDDTFHHPPDFKQLLIFMYKDIITDKKLLVFYILVNSKEQQLYDLVFDSIIKIIHSFGCKEINTETVVTDQETALINRVNKYFPNAQRISCYFHYKSDIFKNLKKYGLWRKDLKKTYTIILGILYSLPIIYNGNMKMITNDKNMEVYSNYLENYFKIYKYKYFADNSLNYDAVPRDCRTNNFIENYNGYIKKKLRKKN